MPNLINVQHTTVGLLGAYISVCLLFLNIHGLDAAVLLVLILPAYTAVVLTFLLVLVHSFLANYFTSCTHLSLSHPHHSGVFHNLDQQS
jgi:hypothetical protein